MKQENPTQANEIACLRLSERVQLYERVFDPLPVAVMIIDEACELLYMNQRAEEIVGHLRTQCLGEKCSMLELPLCNRENCPVARLRCVKGNVGVFERAGRFYQSEASQIHDDAGQLQGYAIVLFDITEQRRAKWEMNLNQQRYRIAARQMRHSIWEYDFELCTLTQVGGAQQDYNLNEVFLDAPTSLVERKIVSPDTAEAFVSLFERMRAGEEDVSCEARGLRKDGTYGWLKVQYTAIRDEQGVPVRAVGILEDITESKWMEQSWEREREYRRSLTADALVYFEYNLTQNRMVEEAQDSLFRIELAPDCTYDDMILTAAEVEVDEQSRAAFCEQMDRKALLAAFSSDERERTVDFQLRGATGQWMWVRCTVHLIREPVQNDVCAFIYIKDIDAQKHVEMALRKRAERDAMTGLYNRETVREHIDEVLSANAEAALIMVDIDNLKTINDTFGHSAGDDAILRVAHTMQEQLGSQTVMGRVGGDEFIALLYPVPPREQLQRQLADLLVQLYTDEDGLRSSASIGVALSPVHGVSFQALYERADAALYRAKSEGKNRYVFFALQDLNRMGHAGLDEESLIDEMEEIVYISDPKTYELIYVNRAGRRCMGLNQTNYRGHKCYQVMQGMTQPCDFCTNDRLQLGKFYIWEHTNTMVQRHYLLKDKLVHWKGQLARMEVALDITEKENISQQLQLRIELQQALVDCISALVDTDVQVEPLERTIDRVLEVIGGYYRADRAYVLENNAAAGTFVNTYEWCANGVIPQRERLQDVPAELMPVWSSAFENRQPILWDDIENVREYAPGEYALLKEQDIHGVYAVPFSVRGSLAGFIGIDNPRAHASDAQLLQSVNYFVGNEIAKRRMSHDLTYLRNHDAMTGLLNCNCFNQAVARLESDVCKQMGVLLADIDGLKKINDIYGHYTGDQVVRRVAQAMADAFGKEHVYRLSGDEFVALCPNESREAFSQCVDRVRRGFIDVDVSLGYTYAERFIDLEAMVSHAEQLLNIQKRAYDHEHNPYSRSYRYESLKDFKQMLDEQWFVPYLQPKMNLKTGQLVGAEALVRLHHRQHGILPPALFIPRMERARLIRYLDIYMLEQVCKILQDWRERGFQALPISLNLSRITILESDWAEAMQKVAQRYPLDAGRVEVEITESASELESVTLGDIAREIHKLGFSLALDDFGAHYTNLSMLFGMNFDVLKLDKSLIADLVQNQSNQTVVKYVLQMCKEMGIQTLAEGVETPLQRRLLTQLGCDDAQGYLFGKPMMQNSFEKVFLSIP